ncbi:MAG TPA: metalloregulator ArsR/SmtB family transcription factor [Capsulimonadaceae bacterium]|nr:metalloregulator ArsR/SmtB family transcription factor [Capsulimonadaceae bacterium]
MVKYQPQQLDRIFGALSDPTRREILTRLAQGSLTISELAEPFNISLPATSKHLRVLEHAGLLTRTKEGKVRRCRLIPHAMDEASRWIEQQRIFWEASLDSLEAYLTEHKGD